MKQWGYAIDSQGKPPDFVLEVAPPSADEISCENFLHDLRRTMPRLTAEYDYTDKRADYERFGIGEYWRLDPSGGEHYDGALSGDRLVDGVYEPIEIEWLDEERCRGYSEALGLYVCWESKLRFFDPVSESYLLTHEDEIVRAEAEQRAKEAERREREAAEAAEAELRRLRARLEESGEA